MGATKARINSQKHILRQSRILSTNSISTSSTLKKFNKRDETEAENNTNLNVCR